MAHSCMVLLTSQLYNSQIGPALMKANSVLFAEVQPALPNDGNGSSLMYRSYTAHPILQEMPFSCKE